MSLENRKEKSPLLVLCISNPKPQPKKLTGQEENRITQLVETARQTLLQTCPSNAVAEVNYYAFLLDQDRCYPELVHFIAWCNAKEVPITICELAESPVLIAPENQSPLKFLEQKDHSVRLLRRVRQGE